MHASRTPLRIALLALLALSACDGNRPDGAGPVRGSVASADGSPIV